MDKKQKVNGFTEFLNTDLNILPLIYNKMQRTPLGNRKIILQKSNIHQTDYYLITPFYKPISKILK